MAIDSTERNAFMRLVHYRKIYIVGKRYYIATLLLQKVNAE